MVLSASSCNNSSYTFAERIETELLVKELSVFFTKTLSVLPNKLVGSLCAVFVSSLDNSESICVQSGQL